MCNIQNTLQNIKNTFFLLVVYYSEAKVNITLRIFFINFFNFFYLEFFNDKTVRFFLNLFFDTIIQEGEEEEGEREGEEARRGFIY